MKTVLADTSYYLAIVNPKDQWHSQAMALSDSLVDQVIVTENVLVELASALSKGRDRLVYLELLRSMAVDASTQVVPASQKLFGRALVLFSRMADKSWSLVDCISFVVMKERRISNALTSDHHFVQAGFIALLK
jgi:hypothetical protein